ncbi:MAG TPA: DUF1194 domain-containing protein [Stellaceae bacterium]|nr:DUF1194 domain-containing protein [Stellaceae bacterium]
MRPRFLRPLAILLVAMPAVLPASAQQAAPPAQAVDVALVLAADVSRSITSDEFQLQRQGYARAIADPDVVKAIEAGATGAIALTFIEWSGSDQQQVVVGWQVVRDPASARQFAATLLAAPRAFYGRTSISAALDFAMAQLKASGVKAERQVIDVSGDGTNNGGRPLPDARAAALAAGVTINGLAIINERTGMYGGGFSGHVQPPGGLPNWYRDNVTGGPGSFLLTVKDFASFGEAMTKKLLNEIAARPAAERLVLKSR